MAPRTSCYSGHPALRPSGQPLAVLNRSRQFSRAAGFHCQAGCPGAEAQGKPDPICSYHPWYSPASWASWSCPYSFLMNLSWRIRTWQQTPCWCDAGQTRKGRSQRWRRRQNTWTAPPCHDLGTAPEKGIQHRCLGLPKVWRWSQGDRLYRGPGCHWQDSILRSVNGASMHHFSGPPHEERRISATTRVAAGNAGLTRFRLVRIAPGFHTSLHGTVTEG